MTRYDAWLESGPGGPNDTSPSYCPQCGEPTVSEDGECTTCGWSVGDTEPPDDDEEDDDEA